jgi:hypothetical protein
MLREAKLDPYDLDVYKCFNDHYHRHYTWGVMKEAENTICPDCEEKLFKIGNLGLARDIVDRFGLREGGTSGC